MTVQEARVERCTELEESEAAYSKAINENVANHSLKSTKLHWKHMEHMQELEMHALKAENKSCQHFLVAHQAVLHQAPPSLKENLHSSYSLLLGPSLSSINPLLSPLHLRWKGSCSPLFLSNQNLKGLLPQRGNIHPQMPRKTRQWKRISPQIHRRNRKTPRKGGQLIGLPPWGSNVQMPLAWIQILWRRQEPIISQLTPGIGFTVIQKICPTYSRDFPKKLAYWASLFSKSNGHGKGWSTWDKLTMFFRLSPRGWNS